MTTVLNITGSAAIELYQAPTGERLALTLATLAGSTMGVVGTDFVFDQAEKLVTYAYHRESTKLHEDTAKTLEDFEVIIHKGNNEENESSTKGLNKPFSYW